ncbi:tetratricopeptide repeat protein [Derxia lacustris]|uniref:tetratricopeptide repeat protein n=1 Tax=Derxia lacustris TaxID=764842 RepID=UPI000A175EF8|nr:tetratricopeptide repeat protein [Derxia lacustris]
MTGFLLLALALGLLALGFVLWPLLGPVANGAAAPAWGGGTAPVDLPSPPRARRTAAVLAVALPLLAAGVYLKVGAPALLTAAEVASVDALLAATRARPGDAAAWRDLAHAQERQGSFADAVESYRRAVALAPDDADLLLDFAVTLGMKDGAHLDGEPERLIERALALAPDHVQALALLGSVRFERQDYAGAVEQWEKVLAQVPPDSDVAASISQGIERARSLGAAAH